MLLAGRLRGRVLAGVRFAEPPEHCCGLNGHHAFTLVRLRLLSTGHKQTLFSMRTRAAALFELRRLRCLNRSLRRCLLCLRRAVLPGGFGLRFGSRLSWHVLLRFVLGRAVSVPPAQRSAQRPAQRVAPLVRSAPFDYAWSRYNRKTKTTREAGRRCRPVGQPEARVPQSNRAPEGHEVS